MEICFQEVCKETHMSEKSERWKYDLATLSDEGWEDFMALGIQLSVNADSASRYKNAIRRFVEFINAKVLPFSFQAFVRYLCACRRQGARGGTLESMRSAMAWLQRVVGMDLFSRWCPTTPHNECGKCTVRNRSIHGENHHFRVGARCRCGAPQVGVM